jgi:ribosomal protein S17E
LVYNLFCDVFAQNQKCVVRETASASEKLRNKICCAVYSKLKNKCGRFSAAGSKFGILD